MSQTKTSAELTLKDGLSRLSYTRACKLLGEKGNSLIREGGKFEVDIDEHVMLEQNCFRLRLPDAIVLITHHSESRHCIQWRCSSCEIACDHVGAAFSLILEEKMALGLAAPPQERVPLESLGEEELLRVALEEREERSRKEKMTLKSTSPSVL